MRRQARSVEGLVSTYVVSQHEIARTLCHRQPLDWLRMIKKHAKPWRVATYHALRQGNQSSTEATLREMQFSPTEMRDFVNGCPLDLREHVAECSPYRVSERKVVIAGKTVVEKDAGWFLEKTGERISSAPIRIEEVLNTSAGRGYYRGRVRLEGEEKPFTVPVTDVDRRGLLHCVRDELRAAGAGVLSFQDQWSRRAAQIALDLSKPTLLTTCDRIGWHPDRRRFIFPRFSIAYGGGVAFDQLPLLREANVPGRDLDAPGCLMPWERDALTPAIVRRAASESQPATVWVPKGAMNRLLSELGAPALDLPAIGESLKEEGALLGEEKLGAEPGWLVGGRWWETQERSFRRAEVAAARTRVRGSS